MKLYLIPFLALVALALHSCKPDNPCNQNETAINETYNLSQADKDKIPFRADGLDTLVYISDEGDTATLYGQGVKTYYSTTSKDRYASPDCSLFDEWNYEHMEYSFKGSKIKNLECKFYIREYGSKFLQFDIDNIQNEGFISISSANNTSLYTDSTIVNGNKYWGIKLYRNYTASDTVKNILYNHSYGILEMRVNQKNWIKKFN